MSSAGTHIDFTPSIVVSFIAIVGASAFIHFLTWGRTQNEIKKIRFAILNQILIILSHCVAIPALVAFMRTQDLNYENLSAWTLLDIPGIIDSFIGLLLMMVELKILSLIVKVLDDPIAHKRVNLWKKIAPPLYIFLSVPYIIYVISWSFIGTPFPLLTAISEYLSMFGVFFLVFYEASQSIYIYFLIFTGRLLSGKLTKSKQKKINLVAILIFVSLSIDLSGLLFYACGRFENNPETSTIFFHLVWVFSG